MTAPSRDGTGRFLVFTAQFGGYDPIMPVFRPVAGVEYLVLSDRGMRLPKPWKLRKIVPPVELTTDRMRNRYYKIHATRLLPEFDRSLYIDAHVQIIDDMTSLFAEFAMSESCLGLMKHHRSISVEDEVERSLRYARITREDVEKNWESQRARQRAAGFEDDLGVFRGGFILRNHRCDEVAQFEDAWWEELRRGVTRDQVALPFALWLSGISAFSIPGRWLFPPHVRRFEHLPRGHRLQRIARWLESRREPSRGAGVLASALRPILSARKLRRRLRRVVSSRLAGRRSHRWALRLLHPVAATRSALARLGRP